MVERVAKAIDDALPQNPDPDDISKAARAAIAAMREPTNDMQLAGWAPIHTTGAAIAEHIWIAMIDAALNEP